MRIQEILTEASSQGVPVISKQEAADRKLFGPVYHGSSSIDTILKTGFDPNRSRPTGVSRQGFRLQAVGNGIANGYPFDQYAPGMGIPAPIHHLGFAVYFTTSKTIAKMYNGDSLKGIREFYLDVPNRTDINFAAPNTMMRWWRQHGYNPDPDILKNHDVASWIQATDELTKTLSSQYDAVWFKGKSIRGRALDGDQIAVYDASRIYVIDPKLSSGLDIGAKVRHNQKILHYADYPTVELDDVIADARFTGWRAMYRRDAAGSDSPFAGRSIPLLYIPPPTMVGVIVKKSELAPHTRDHHGGRSCLVSVKWQKGGT
jgi:hypothetical protein